MIGLALFHLTAFVVGFVVLLLFSMAFAYAESERVAYGFMVVAAYLIGLALVSAIS